MSGRLLVTVLLLVAACTGGEAQTQGSPVLRPGGLVASSAKGYEATLRSFDGTPVVVNYWATWCAPCKEEMPRLVEAAKRYEGRVEFLGVDVQDVTEEAQKFIDEQGIPFPNLADEGGKIKLAQGVLGLPSTEFYRADGELAGIHRGEISAEELERRIEELLAVGVPATPPG